MTSEHIEDILITILSVVLMLTAVLGWLFNLIKLADSDVLTGMVVLRAIGVIVVPLGSVLGFL